MATSTTMLYSDCTIEAELGTTTVDLSGSSNSVTINLEMITGEASVFNDPWPQRVMTAKNCTIDLAAWYSTASNEAQDYFADWFNSSFPIATKTFTFYLPQKAVGARTISAKFVFTGMNITAKAADTAPVAISTQLLNAGTVTVSTYST